MIPELDAISLASDFPVLVKEQTLAEGVTSASLHARVRDEALRFLDGDLSHLLETAKLADGVVQRMDALMVLLRRPPSYYSLEQSRGDKRCWINPSLCSTHGLDAIHAYVEGVKRFCIDLGAVMGKVLRCKGNFLNGEYSVQLAIYVSTYSFIHLIQIKKLTCTP